MKTAILFIIVLTYSILFRTVIADSFTKKYIEEETALLTCSSEFKETMKITTIKYEKGTCSHNDLYGIGNICNGRKECLFKVTNSNVGSSCGANGTASLGVTFNCIRNGGWSQWKNATTSCPVNCGGALQNVTRTCANPTPNEFGASCSGTNFDEQICNDNACPFAGTVCKDSRIVWTCQYGYIQMKRALWKASNGCGEPGSISSYDVVREIIEICNERKSCTLTAKDSTFKLSCRELYKACSQLEYEYICRNAKWSSWIKWSLCSKSCGTGKQIRTRNCLNQFNTTDGYFVDCEGSSVETRVCNTMQCPYCNDNIFPHHMSSNRKLKSAVTTNSAMTNIYKISCCGTIKAFKFIPMNTGEVRFIVWRRMRGHSYKAISQHKITVTDQNVGKYVQHNLTKYERIAVVHDDIVGWYDGGNNIIGYYDCSPINETCLALSLLRKPVNDGDEIDTEGLLSITDKTFAWNFYTTENTAVELSFADDSIKIPDNSAIDTYVTHIRMEDPDQGDFIENIKLDYHNQYFYFDTKLRNVYVKNVLPHTVGQKFVSLNITLTVQDSCYNEVTSNVTIITYNVPPVISGIQKCLIIDPIVAQRAPYLTMFKVKDPSADNVTCMIKETNPPTDLFYLQLINIDVYLKLVDGVSIGRDSTSQYTLTIICDDGTDNTELDIKIQFRPQNEDAIVKMYTEGESAHLTCSIECNETMYITSIKYTQGPCSHNETYGIGNLCNGKTNCSFHVSNSNIGSSCGADRTAILKVEYTCLRNGGWSLWTTSAPCPVMCGGGGFQNVTRTCSNPYKNEKGNTCKGEAFDEHTCNSHDCVVQNTACLNEKVDWNCQNGHIEVIKAEWETSTLCGSSFLRFFSYDVIDRTKMNCDNRQTCSFIANDHYLGISCSTSAARCTTLKFVYVCIKATWEGWSSWSVCTRSCGSGIQTRHRQCVNQMNTKDGYKADCNGNGSHSRSCHTEPCPYCSDTNLLHALPKSLSDLKEDTSPGSGMLHLNGIFAVNCCGRIKTWKFIPVKTGSLTFVILRKTNGYKYICVGSNAVHISALDLHTPTQFDVADSERIVIIQEDIIGWYGSGNNIGYYDCTTTAKACPLSLLLNDPVNVGDIIDVDRLNNLFNRTYAFNYSTTENRPVTFNISSEPVIILDHLKLDAFVMTIPIYDPDNRDFIQDFELDYKNEYFYLDTKRRSIHVKKALPHVVGHPNSTLNFTCTVEDSCFNLANITITFISINVPPVVTDLPDVLILDPQQLSDNSSFHIFNVEDPSNDNVSCDLRKISPSTEKLTLEFDDNEAFLHVFKHSTSNTTLEYELEIYCDDGTDETIIKLVVYFSSKKNNESAELKITYVSGSIGGLLLIVIIIVVFYYCFSKRRKTLITSKSSNDSKSNSLYTSIIYDNAVVNLYDNIEHIGNKQIPTDNFEMSKPDTNLYENTKIFI